MRKETFDSCGGVAGPAGLGALGSFDGITDFISEKMRDCEDYQGATAVWQALAICEARMAVRCKIPTFSAPGSSGGLRHPHRAVARENAFRVCS